MTESTFVVLHDISKFGSSRIARHWKFDKKRLLPVINPQWLIEDDLQSSVVAGFSPRSDKRKCHMSGLNAGVSPRLHGLVGL